MQTQSPSTIIRRLRELVPNRPLDALEHQAVAEQQARRLLVTLGIKGPAVDVGLIAERLDLPFRVMPDMRSKQLSGYSELSGRQWLITISGDDSLTRRRFSMGHEIKHVLDHPFMDAIYLDDGDSISYEMADEVADHFAASLLMPRPWIERAITWHGIRDAKQLAALFVVSPIAMNKRLKYLGLHRMLPDRLKDRPQVRRYFRPAPAPKAVPAKEPPINQKGGTTNERDTQTRRHLRASRQG